MPNEREPWFKVRVGIARSDKLGALPSDAARWGWIRVLAEAKLQRQMGMFGSRRHLATVLGQHGRFVDAYIAAALLEEAPALCVRCVSQHPEVLPQQLVVHDYRREQRDASNAERQAAFRGRQRNADSNAPANAIVTGTVTPSNAIVTADSRARGMTERVTEREEVPSTDREHSLPRALARPREGTRPKKVEGFSTPGELDWHLTLDQRQLEAWTSFGPEWDAVKAAWLGRGLRYPPAGTARDEPGAESPSPRAMLWSVLEARPTDLPRWIAEAPRGVMASGVISYVLECWHHLRDEETERAANEEAVFDLAIAANRQGVVGHG